MDGSLVIPAHRRPDYWLVHGKVFEKASWDEVFVWIQQELAKLDIGVGKLEYPEGGEVTLNCQYMTMRDMLNALASMGGCCWMILDEPPYLYFVRSDKTARMEELAKTIVDEILVGVDKRTRAHYIAVIRNYLHDCITERWGLTSWRTQGWKDDHTEMELFEDWTIQFMAIQPMAYPYPEHLGRRLIDTVMETGKRYLVSHDCS